MSCFYHGNSFHSTFLLSWLGFTQFLWKSHFSFIQRALHILIDQNIAVFSSLNLRVFSWMFRSIGIAEREESLYTYIPLCFPSRENACMSYCCILSSPPVWSVYVHTCVFNICKIPKIFAQRILLFPVYFIWCLPWRKNPVDWNLEWKVKWFQTLCLA